MSSPTLNDDDQAGTDLARRACGDPARFRELRAMYHARLVGLIRRKGVPEREIDDVAQDVWVKIHRQFQRDGTFEGNFRGWLLQLGYTTAIDCLRSLGGGRGRGVSLDDNDIHADPKSPDPATALVVTEDVGRLRDCIEKLTEVLRFIVRERLAGRSPVEIAAQVTRGDRKRVDVLYHRAKQELAQCLGCAPGPDLPEHSHD